MQLKAAKKLALARCSSRFQCIMCQDFKFSTLKLQILQAKRTTTPTDGSGMSLNHQVMYAEPEINTIITLIYLR